MIFARTRAAGARAARVCALLPRRRLGAGTRARASGAGAQVCRPDRQGGSLRNHAGRGRHRDHAHAPVAEPGQCTSRSTQAITKTLDDYKERKGELIDQFARVYAQRLHAWKSCRQIVDVLRVARRPEARRRQRRRQQRPPDGHERSSRSISGPSSSPGARRAEAAGHQPLARTRIADIRAPPCAGSFFVRCAAPAVSAERSVERGL